MSAMGGFRRWGLVALVAATGCHKGFNEPYKIAGGKTLDPKGLNDGREAFMLYCYGCHGAKGDGRGPSSAGMRPPPRNFGQGLFKFAGVAAGQLPVDDALLRTIRRGLNGTPMLPWDIPDVERHAIVQYLKTLSKRWEEEEPGEPIEISPDPWGGREPAALSRGKEVYHVAAEGHAGCSGCHVSYATRDEISEMTKKVTGQPVTEFPEEMYRPTLRETEYALAYNDQGEPTQVVKQLPPDFLFHKVKSAYPVGTRVDGKPYSAEEQRKDLYRTIAAGIGGAAMPQWKGALPEENLWALVYYVQSLIEIRGTPAAYALREKLEAQPKWTPPPSEQPPPGPPIREPGREPAPPKAGGAR